MPEYIFTNLPQYVKITPRSDFSSSVVSSGAVLLFSEDGLTLTGKLPDGTFITIGGSSGPDPVGDATSGDILAGKSATVSGGSVISGTIPTVSAELSGSQVVVPTGYIATSQTFNVSGGVDVSDTTAQAADVLSGKVFYNSGGIQTSGTIPTVSATLAGNLVTVPVGYIATAQTFNVSGGVDVSDTTATAATVLSGYDFHDSAGVKTNGTIPTLASSSYTPGTADQVISSGQYLGGDQTIAGDANLVASNIVSGASIFGVSGTAETGTDVSDTTAMPMDVRSGAIFYDADGIRTTGTIPSMGAFYITPSTSDYEIPDGVYIDGGIIVKGDSNLVGSNIVSGASIFGVPGELIVSSGAEVTLGYITSGGQFQPLAFSGTSAADSGSPVTLSCYTWNLPTFTSGVIVSSGMSLFVSAPLNYISTTINNGGHMYVLSGGTATNTQVDSGGSMEVSSGGTAAGITAYGRTVRIFDGGSAYDFDLQKLLVGFSQQTYVSGSVGGSQVVLSGTSIADMDFPSGLWVDLYSGTFASNINISADAQIQFGSGASGVGISAGGTDSIITVWGGSASGVAVADEADLRVFSGGTAAAVNVYINGTLHASSGATLINTYIDSGGTGDVNGANTVLSGGAVYPDGHLILSNGTATDITVSSGGTLTLYAGNVVTSNITSETGAVIINS